MPLSLLNHPALALFAQRTRIPTSARSIGFCAIWVVLVRVRVRGGELDIDLTAVRYPDVVLPHRHRPPPVHCQTVW